MTKRIIQSVLCTVLVSPHLFAMKVEVIKDPKPTCYEKNVVQLKRYRVINKDIDENNFIAHAKTVTVNGRGDVYVFDRMQNEIFIFDKELKFKKRFGNRGKGPGEFATHRMSPGVQLNITGADRLYAQDHANRRVTVFNLEGEYITDYKTKYWYPFIPAADKQGNLYIPSVNHGVLDVYNTKMELLTTLLDEKEFRTFLYLEPKPIYMRKYSFANYGNLSYALLDDNRVLIYILPSSTVYLLEKNKLKRKFHAWPDNVLKYYKRALVAEYKEYDDVFVPISINFFIDEDDHNHFYIQFLTDEETMVDVVYKFNLKGELLKVLTERSDEVTTHFKCKRHNTFYAYEIGDGDIALYKEDK